MADTTASNYQPRSFSRYDPQSPPKISHRTPGPQEVRGYQPLPAPVGKPPYHLTLDAVLPPDTIRAITQNQRLVFHVCGDTGGIKVPQEQQIVAMHQVYDLDLDPPARPAYFYHLGDVVYYYGEASSYYDQFYEAYEHYGVPIFAIPGNHDGDVDPTAKPPPSSLAAFVENFCAKEVTRTPEAGDIARDAMTQPHVYWTLDTPLVTIVGLYTNVPEGGKLDDDQVAWLHAELKNASTDRPLLLAAHHPVFSLDDHHSGSTYLKELFDDAFAQTGRLPDLILSGHVHNYQRFTRTFDQREVPYVVAGAGGYWHLHYLSKAFGNPVPLPYVVEDVPNLVLENYLDSRHGYLTLDVTPTRITGTYTPVPRPQEPWTDRLRPIDNFILDVKEHRLVR